jgi:hypothetical protein
MEAARQKGILVIFIHRRTEPIAVMWKLSVMPNGKNMAVR